MAAQAGRRASSRSSRCASRSSTARRCSSKFARPSLARKSPVEANGPAGGFTQALKSALDGVNDTQSNAEALGDAYQRGEVTDVAKVMLARQEAGVAFEATLQVRNKLLSAYQDIMRMGV